MKIRSSLQADFALLLITIVWASTFAITKKCLGQISPVLFVAIRFWIASLASLIFLGGALRGISGRTLGRGLLLSILVSAGCILQTQGLQVTTPSRCAFITGLFVLLVPLMGFLLTRQWPKRRTICGVAVATAGLALLTLNPRDLTPGHGDILTLLCAIVFALHILLLGHYLSAGDFRQLVVVQLIGTAVLCTLLVPSLEIPAICWDSHLGASLLFTGLVATAVATYVQNSAQRFASPTRAALVFSLEPLFAAFFSSLLLGLTMTGRESIGGALIIAGIAASELRKQATTEAVA